MTGNFVRRHKNNILYVAVIKTYSVIGFKVQHHLCQCCIIVLFEYKFKYRLFSFCCPETVVLLLLFLALVQATTVGPVLSVNKLLHPKLSSQQFFSVLFQSLLDGFNLGLERNEKKR